MLGVSAIFTCTLKTPGLDNSRFTHLDDQHNGDEDNPHYSFHVVAGLVVTLN
jgi:hypothetical protein